MKGMKGINVCVALKWWCQVQLARHKRPRSCLPSHLPGVCVLLAKCCCCARRCSSRSSNSISAWTKTICARRVGEAPEHFFYDEGRGAEAGAHARRICHATWLLSTSNSVGEATTSFPTCLHAVWFFWQKNPLKAKTHSRWTHVCASQYNKIHLHLYPFPWPLHHLSAGTHTQTHAHL